jgi:glycosyltransferase involved in cell wall biosynthesis
VFAGEDRGQARYARSVRRQAETHSIDTLCRMVGHCADMPAAYAVADVVAIPALELPLAGRAAAEAQSMGRSVVATAVRVLPENLLCPPRMKDELRTGWLVRPGNVGELARAARRRAPAQCYVLRGARRPRAAIRRIRLLAAERCRSHSRRLYLAVGSRYLRAPVSRA